MIILNEHVPLVHPKMKFQVFKSTDAPVSEKKYETRREACPNFVALSGN
jgi:hypothetical protein